jgi:hypothetical protein
MLALATACGGATQSQNTQPTWSPERARILAERADTAVDEGFRLEHEALTIACADANDAECDTAQTAYSQRISERREQALRPLRDEVTALLSEGSGDVPCTREQTPCAQRLRLLDPGRGPLELLRYRWTNTKARLVITVRTYFCSDGPCATTETNSALPAAHFELDVAAVPVADSPEHTRVTYTITRSSAVVASDAAQLMDQYISLLNGSSITLELDARGRTASTVVLAAQHADTELKAALDRLADRLAMMIVPLPEQPVGRGAHWQVVRAHAQHQSVISYRASSLGFEHLAVVVSGFSHEPAPVLDDAFDRLTGIAAKSPQLAAQPALDALERGSLHLRRGEPVISGALYSSAYAPSTGPYALRIDHEDEIGRQPLAYPDNFIDFE